MIWTMIDQNGPEFGPLVSWPNKMLHVYLIRALAHRNGPLLANFNHVPDKRISLGQLGP